MLNKHKVGLTLGVLVGTLHVVWSLFVAVGLAKPWMDFFHSIHFMTNPMTIQDFSFSRAILLVLVASLIWYVVGWLFGYFWNRFHQ